MVEALRAELLGLLLLGEESVEPIGERACFGGGQAEIHPAAVLRSTSAA